MFGLKPCDLLGTLVLGFWSKYGFFQGFSEGREPVDIQYSPYREPVDFLSTCIWDLSGALFSLTGRVHTLTLERGDEVQHGKESQVAKCEAEETVVASKSG